MYEKQITPTTAPRRVELPASLLMALHVSALAEGGIGRGAYWEPGDPDRPRCIVGHALALRLDTPVWMVLAQFDPLTGPHGSLAAMSERVVRSINARRNAPDGARIDFETWIAECERLYGVAIIPIDDAEPVVADA